MRVHLGKTQKLIMAGIGVLLCALAILIIYRSQSLGSKKSEENLRIIFDENRPIPIFKDGKYGYITKNGESLIEPSYTSAGAFWDGYAAVSKDGVYEIIDEKGSTVAKPAGDKEPKYYNEKGIWVSERAIYDRDLSVIMEGNYGFEYIADGYVAYLDGDKKESGIVDSSGSKVFSWQEDYIAVSASPCNLKEKDIYAVVSNFEEREEIINLRTGKSVYKIDDAKNKYLRQEKDNVFRLINRQVSYKTEKWYYFKDDKIVFESDKEIYSVELEDYEKGILKIDYGQNYRDAGVDSRYKYYDIENDKYLDESPVGEKTPELYRTLFDYHIIEDSSKVGLRIGEETVIEPNYERIVFLDLDLYKYLLEAKMYEYVFLEEGNKIILYNIANRKTIEEFSMAGSVSSKDSTFIVATLYEANGYTKRSFLVYNLATNKQMEFDKDETIEVYANYITVTGKKQKSYYNTDLKEIYREEL